jgi:hypothetical protein
VIQVAGALQFQVYQPSDKSATAIFSAGRGNLSAYEYSEQGPEVNFIYIGGAGTGTTRTFREHGLPTSIVRWGARIEDFIDGPDSTDITELDQAIDAELDQHAEQSSLSLTPMDTDALAFLDDYGLGDKVTAIVDGEPIQDIVREVHITLTPDGAEQITPTIGTPGQSNNSAALGVFDELRRLQARVKKLEGR